ncbi:MAG: OsmC family protein [Candidatus Eisenbacteria bacterium]|uniref:OsmC family protein n=1 Tax=Eiseniibacteriota bacterium TaxID=2212470 RepID=A0A937X8G3_UNCEI|nr:OsmC family protein [Candidatus Eisenbacteria bacterium]
MPQATPATSVATWIEEALFEHATGSGVTYRTDAPVPGHPPAPLRGPKPMEMLLGAAAGCSGADIVSVLAKMRLDLRSLRIRVEGERQEEHPRVYRRIRVIYEIDTDPIDPDKAWRAVELSATRYCGVLATLAATARVDYTLHCAGREFRGVLSDAPPTT